MIQRIQTVYLFLGALAAGAPLLLSPMWSGEAAQQFGWFTPVAVGLAALTAVGALAIISLYKQRPRQRAFAAGLQMLAALMTILFFVSYYGVEALGIRTAEGALDFEKIAFLVLPVVAYGFFLLARRAIQSDIELVRSMDRLR